MPTVKRNNVVKADDTKGPDPTGVKAAAKKGLTPEEREAKAALLFINRGHQSLFHPKDLQVPGRELIYGEQSDDMYDALLEAKALGQRAYRLRLEVGQTDRRLEEARALDAKDASAAVRAGEPYTAGGREAEAQRAAGELRREHLALERAAWEAYGEFRVKLKACKYSLKVESARENQSEWMRVIELIDELTAYALTRQARRLVALAWAENPYKLPTGPDQNVVGLMRQVRHTWTDLPRTEDGQQETNKLGPDDAHYPTNAEQKSHVFGGAAVSDDRAPDGAAPLQRTSQGVLATEVVNDG